MSASNSGRTVLSATTDKLRTIFDLESSGRAILYSAIVGVVAGLGAAGFFWGLEGFKHLALGSGQGYYPPVSGSEELTHTPQLPTYWWAVLLIPTLGGLASGLLVYTYAPEAEGDGADAVIRIVHSVKGRIRGRVPFLKAVTSIFTIGTGGSSGREGPIAQIGAGFGSFLADRLRLSDWERRVLILAGTAAGIGAIFRAPLGGALFGVEVLYASTAVEFTAIVPCVVASVVAYSVFAAIYGPGLAFTAPGSFRFEGPSELPFYLVFAVLCALVGYVYVWCFYGVRDYFFRRLPIPRHVKPAIGGLLLGAIALAFPQVMAGGYGWIQEAINGHIAVQLMAILVLAKIVATSVTISSGGSGGVFAPSLFIGAMLGGAYGTLCDHFFPGLSPRPEIFVLVGMGGFFAGVAKVPLTALIMVSEMSGSYNLLVPLMLVCVINVAVLSSHWSVYEAQVNSLIDSPVHFGDFVIDILEGMQVRQVYKPQRKATLIRENMPLPKLLHVVASSKDSYFPVVDESDRLVGIFSLHDIRSALVGNGAGNLILASDLATAPVLTVTPDDNLHTVLRYYMQKHVEELPVVDPGAPDRVVCMLRRDEVIAAYDQQMAALRSQHRAYGNASRNSVEKKE